MRSDEVELRVVVKYCRLMQRGAAYQGWSLGGPSNAWAVSSVTVPELCVSQLAGPPRFKASHLISCHSRHRSRWSNRVAEINRLHRRVPPSRADVFD